MRRPKLRAIMAKYHHRESDLQIRCVKWFRISHPELAYLLYHPHNEGNAFNRRQQTIANAEGVKAGVADLILQLPAVARDLSSEFETTQHYNALAIEMKTEKGRQSDEQQYFQRYFEAAGGKYIIVRSFETFQMEINAYLKDVPLAVTNRIKDTWSDIDAERQAEAKRQLEKLINKQK